MVCKYHVVPSKRITYDDVARNIVATLNSQAIVFEVNYKQHTMCISFPENLFLKDDINQFLSRVMLSSNEDIAKFELIDFDVKLFKPNKVHLKKPLILSQLRESDNSTIVSELWQEGVDIIIDSPSKVYSSNSDFLKNLTFIEELKRKIEDLTGQKKIYIPNITSDFEQMKKFVHYINQLENYCFINTKLILLHSKCEKLRSVSNGFANIEGLAALKLASILGFDYVFCDDYHDYDGIIPIIQNVLPKKAHELRKYGVVLDASKAIFGHPDGHVAGIKSIIIALKNNKFDSKNQYISKSIHRMGY